VRRTAGHAQPKPNDPPPSGELQIVFGKAAYTFSDETIIFDPALGLAISNKNIFPIIFSSVEDSERNSESSFYFCSTERNSELFFSSVEGSGME